MKLLAELPKEVVDKKLLKEIRRLERQNSSLLSKLGNATQDKKEALDTLKLLQDARERMKSFIEYLDELFDAVHEKSYGFFR